MNEFIIVFRECLEASLVVGIIYTILAKSNFRDAIQKLWLGVAASIVASLGVAYVVISLKDALGNNSSMALFEAIFMYITAGLIWYVVFWLSKHVSDRKVLEGKTMTAVKISSWGVFFVTFFAILREGFETVVFLISSFSITESFSYVGFITGAVLAILIGYLVVIQGKRINLKRFFQGTTLLLVFLASGMVAYGTHEIESYLVKSNQLNKDNISRPWDILKPKTQLNKDDLSFLYSYDNEKKSFTHALHDSGSVGVFLKGFFGYNSNPNYVELIMWLLSLVYGLNLWRRFYY
jgi:high-affinity iron transporter